MVKKSQTKEDEVKPTTDEVVEPKEHDKKLSAAKKKAYFVPTLNKTVEAESVSEVHAQAQKNSKKGSK